MNHIRCVVMLILLSEPVDGDFQSKGQGTCRPPDGVDLLPHIATCKGPHIAETHVMVQLHSSTPLPQKRSVRGLGLYPRSPADKVGRHTRSFPGRASPRGSSLPSAPG